jgi:hypothetical protein
LNNTNYIQNTGSVDRLIALWALSEGFLGGFLHLAKIPLTGLILGNVSVIIITLIAKFSGKSGTILKATLIVLIVKGILSPYTPLTAYLAVSLQGILGEILFYKRKFPFISALTLGILVSLFSSVQKVFFLTVIFGQNLWDSIDQFTLIIFKEFFGLINSNITISIWLIVIYVSIHLLAGILTGLYAARLARRTDVILKNESNKILFDINSFTEEKNSKIKKSKHRWWWFKPSGIIFFVLTTSLFVYSYLYPDYPYIRKDSLLVMLFRGILLMFIWYKFFSPLLMIAFKKTMAKKRNKYTNEIENVVNVLPLFKSIINFCWKETSQERGLKRLHRFFILSLLNLLKIEINKE